MRSIINWFAGNHVAANLLMIFVLLSGIVTLLTMKIETFPEISLDLITVTVPYPGASPEEVEEGVILQIEDSVAGLAGIKRIDATAREGVGTVSIEVIKDWDIDELLDEVKAEVDRITTFPEEAEEPIVEKVTRRRQVINVAVYGQVSESVLKRMTQKFKDEITALPGITLAELFGIRESEIHIQVAEKTLRKYGLTLGAVAEQVRRSSLDLPAGDIESSAGEVLIRTKSRKDWAREFQAIPVISQPNGSVVTLGDIAKITDDFEEQDLEVIFQGYPAAVIQVFRVADQNALDVSSTVKDYVQSIQSTMPHGIYISTFDDATRHLRSRIKLLLKNLSLGLILVSILLGIFLNIRLAFWVTLGIPISFFTGIMFLPYFDISINMISLFAFILVLGIVVDDAIVVGENIYTKQQQGLPPMKASVDGAYGVGRPVIFAVLTTIAAFWPLLLGGGTTGKFMRNLPIVVNLVLLASLMESLLILPCHLNKTGPSKKGKQKEQWISRGLDWFIQNPYSRLLKLSLKWRYATLAIGISVLLLTFGIWRGGFIKFTFFPRVESDTMTCNLTMVPGTPTAQTKEVLQRLEQTANSVLKEVDKSQILEGEELLEYTLTLLGTQIVGGPNDSGGSGSNVAQVFVQLLESEKRNISTQELVKRWRNRVGGLSGVESITFQGELFGFGNPIEVDLAAEDRDLLVQAADDLKEELGKYAGVFDINDSFIPGKDEIRVSLKPKARSLGLTNEDLARQVRHAFYGAEALKFQRGKNEVTVRVLYPEQERNRIASLKSMRIRTQEGKAAPFYEVSTYSRSTSYTTIDRSQRRRVVTVSADVDESKANANEVRLQLTKSVLPKLLDRYPGLHYTMEGTGREQQETMAGVKKGFVIALFAIFSLLAIPLRSFSQPLVIMLAIPFSMVGAIWGHLLMGFNLSILSLFGIVGLAGVAVNDSLILVSAVNLNRETGQGIPQAAFEAGQQRFRAVLLTSLTTFAGLSPMILEKSLQAQFLIPMAISLGFGILFATVITLVLIPCLVVMLEDFHELKDSLLGNQDKEINKNEL